MANEENQENINRSFQRLEKINKIAPNFCSMKWSSTTINLGNGHCQSCPLNKSTRVKSYDLSNNSLALYNTPKIMSDRETILRGQWPEDCGTCKEIEQSSNDLISPRIVNSTNETNFNVVNNLSTKELTSPIYPSTLELSFSNKCNMKCIYCGPENSSSWLDEVREKGSYPANEGEHDLRWLDLDNRLPVVNQDKNPYVDAFIESWDELYPNLKELKLTGGEPLLIDETWDCFDLIEAVPNHELDLKVHSNLNHDTDLINKFAEKITAISQHIKSFELLTSCEATGAQAEYIRDGLDYKKFISNLDLVLSNTPDTFKTTVVVTANLLSASTLVSFLETILEMRKKHTKTIEYCRLHFYLNPVSWPPFLKLENLDIEIKKKLINGLTRFKESNAIPDNYEHNGYLYLEEINQIDSLIEKIKINLSSEEYNRNNKNFSLFANEFNKRRSKDFDSLFPELKKYFYKGLGEEIPAEEATSKKTRLKDKEVVSLEHSGDFAREHVVVNWCLTSICNYKCSYCPDELHDGKFKGPPIEDIKKFVDKISNHYDKKIFFEFTGGEVTFYKHFDELVSYIKSKGCDVGILSNGSRPIKWFEERLPLLDHICLTFHNEFVKPDHFMEVVKLLCDKITLHINIMMDPKNFDFCYDFAKKISNEVSGVSIAIQPVLEGMIGDLVEYSPEQSKILQEQKLYKNPNAATKGLSHEDMRIYRGHMKQTFKDGSVSGVDTAELISNNENSWKGWHCYAGVENLVIEFDGSIYRGWCKVGSVVGNISDKELILPTKPITCDVEFCNCGLDIMCTKEKVLR